MTDRTNDDFTMRTGRIEDLPGWSAVLDDPSVTYGTMQTPHTSLEVRRERWTRMLEDYDGTAALVAVDGSGDGIIGSLSLHKNRNHRRGHVAGLGMGVLTDWQGRGVGSALLTAACELAEGWWNIRRMELNVYTDNEAAIALYRKFGFEIEGTHRAFAFRAGEYVDAHSMARINVN